MSMLRLFVCLFLMGTPLALRAQEASPALPDKPFYVILKLDDFNGFKNEMPRWQKLHDFAVERKIKVTIGIICKFLDDQPAPNPDLDTYAAWVKDFQQTGLVEYWNHGYDHETWKDADGKQVWEFKGASYEQQKDHLTRAQKLAQEKLGVTLRAFGAPFNQVDAATMKALSEDPDLNVMFYGPKAWAKMAPNLTILEGCELNLEKPTFEPNPQWFQETFPKVVGTRDCFVLQGHPGKWKDERFANFVAIVDFLTAKGARFVTSEEYLALKKGEAAVAP